MTTHTVGIEDDKELIVKHFNGGTKGSTLCKQSLTTTYAMRALETVPVNFVEAITEQRHAVWAENLHFGRLKKAKNVDCTLDDVANHDYLALFDFIENEIDPSSWKLGIDVHDQFIRGHSFSIVALGGHIGLT